MPVRQVGLAKPQSASGHEMRNHASRTRALTMPLLASAICLWMLPAPVPAQQQGGPKDLGHALDDIHVVEGKIVSFTRLPRRSDEGSSVSAVELEVWRVFCGKGVADSTRFSAMLGQGQPAMRGQVPELPLLDRKGGDHRVWIVEHDPDADTYRAIMGPHSMSDDPDASESLTAPNFLLPFLCNRLADEPEHLEAAPKVAAALYTLAHAKDEAERVRLLKDQVRGGDPYVAVTDCWLLHKAQETPDRGAVAMELFLDPKVPIVARTSLDGIIRESNGANRGSTPQRNKALVDMAASARTKTEFLALGIALRRGAGVDLPIIECLDVTRAALANERFLVTCDQKAATLLLYYAESAKGDAERDMIFEFFLSRIGSGTDSRFEFAAANAIASCAAKNPLNAAQVESLSKVRATTQNPWVTEALGWAISDGRK